MSRAASRSGSQQQIRAARLTALRPLQQKRPFALHEHPLDNWELPTYRGLIVKDSYWRWPQRNSADSSIHFFVNFCVLSPIKCSPPAMDIGPVPWLAGAWFTLTRLG